MKEEFNPQIEKKAENRITITLMEWVKIVIASFIISQIIGYTFAFSIVSGHSMNPTLSDNERLIANKFSYIRGNYSTGNIVIFESELNMRKGLGESYYVKRIIALPNDHIKIRNGNVYLNGEELVEDYIPYQLTNSRQPIDMVIPEGYVFVMGDNRDNSIDSRFESMGLISTDDILGKVVLRFFPFERFSFIR